MMKQDQDEASISLEKKESEWVACLKGQWQLRNRVPHWQAFVDGIGDLSGVKVIHLDTSALESWDTSLLTFLRHFEQWAFEQSILLDTNRLPKGLLKLMNEVQIPKDESDYHSRSEHHSVSEHVGEITTSWMHDFYAALHFQGEMIIALFALFKGKARTRAQDFWLIIEESGARALPITALISYLVGLILAFVGSVQLQPFGADIYVANMVGIAMIREMGCMMAAMVMAGRTGAAFAAQLGSMVVNEEIDALRTFGISPMEFLVIPRVVGLMLMLPLLTVFADFIGIVGGMIVAVSMLDVTVAQYYNQTVEALTVTGLLTGLIKSLVFGLIIGATGCFRGLQCKGSASDVGNAATSAVVTSMTLIIIADAAFAVIFNLFDI